MLEGRWTTLGLLFWSGLLAACGSGSDCPPGFRLEAEVCVTAGGQLDGLAEAEGNQGSQAGIEVALLGTDRAATTDTDGRWSMRGLAAGAYDLRFSFAGHAPVVLEGVTVSADTQTTVDPVQLRLRPEGTRLTGVVRTEGGGEAEAALVYLDGTSSLTLTGADGAFALDRVPPGAHTLVVRLEGYRRFSRPVTVAPADVELALEPVVLVAAEGTAGPVGALAGRVTLGGATQGNAGVQVYLEGTGYTAFTADDGTFLLDPVAAGTYTLHAVAAGWTAAVVGGVQVAAAETTTVEPLDLSPAPADQAGTVSGTVTPFGLSDAGGTTVRLVGATGVVAEAVTGADGGYGFDAVPHGLYRIDFEHPPWQPHTVEPVVVAEGHFRAPPVALYLGRRIDARRLVDAELLSADRMVLWLEGDGGAEPVLFDAASGLKVPLEGEAVIPLAHEEEHDRVFLLSVKTLPIGQQRDVVEVDLATGLQRVVASSPRYWAAHPDGLVFSDLEERVWEASLVDGTVTLVAEPACTGSRVRGLWPQDDTLRLTWDVEGCSGSGWIDFYQYYDPATGRLSSVFYRPMPLGPSSTAYLVSHGEPDPYAPRSLVRYDFGTGLESVLAETAQATFFLDDHLFVQHVPPGTEVATISAVEPSGALTFLVDEATYRDSAGGFLLFDKGREVWAVDTARVSAFRACVDVDEALLTPTGELGCREGAASPYRVKLVDLGTRSTRTLSYGAEAAHFDWNTGLLTRWKESSTGTWRVNRSDVSTAYALCAGDLGSVAYSGDGEWIAFQCTSSGLGTIRMQALTSSVAHEVLPPVSRLQGISSLTTAGAGVVASYRLTSVGTGASDCGSTQCFVAYSAATGQRQLVPQGLSWPEVVWSRDGKGVAVSTSSAKYHLVFGASPSWFQGTDWGWPRAVGPTGRFALWSATEPTLTDAATGTAARVEGSYPTCLADGSWCISGPKVVDLASGSLQGRGVAPTYPQFSADRNAASWLTTEDFWGSYVRLTSSGPATLGAYVTTRGSDYILVQATGARGRLHWRDPETLILHEVLPDAYVPDASLGDGRWLAWSAPSTAGNSGDLQLVGPGGAVVPLGVSAGLSEPHWQDAPTATRIAVNAWSGGELRLTGVDLDGGVPTPLGPAASDVRFTPTGGTAFAAEGLWWQEAAGGAVPLDRWEHLPSAVFAPNGDTVVYGVDPSTGPDATRQGTWLATVP